MTTHRHPARHRLAVVTWVAIYPTITLVLAMLEPLGLFALPLPLRTLALTLLLVPLMVFAVMPALHRVFATWLHG